MSDLTGKQLTELKEHINDNNGDVFFEDIDEKKIVEHKQSIIDNEANELARAHKRLENHVRDVVFNPKPDGDPYNTLQEMEDFAMGEGLDADEVELILHGL